MKIGTLKQVNLRDVWAKEASDFTTWLGDNIGLLSETLDLDLTVIEIEKKLEDSRYSIDIYAEDDSGRNVIIENQLEKTDHTHLGQILTYGVNVDADIVIWLAKELRPEHMNVINWLNEHTDKDFYFLTVQALEIDGSLPAPYFNVVCKPSETLRDIGKNKKTFEKTKSARRLRRAKADTIVVPAQKEGFDRVFVGENSWYSIRINKNRIGQLKYIAGYQTAPISAITHVAEIKEIISCNNIEGKYRVNFKGRAKEIEPIPLGVKSRIQSPVYCEYSLLSESSSIDDLMNQLEDTKTDAAA